MATVFKYLAQFLLIPLIKEFVNYIVRYFKERAELKRIEQENKKKQERYEQASVDSAHDEFGRLP